jgi:hypothetical protein
MIVALLGSDIESIHSTDTRHDFLLPTFFIGERQDKSQRQFQDRGLPATSLFVPVPHKCEKS